LVQPTTTGAPSRIAETAFGLVRGQPFAAQLADEATASTGIPNAASSSFESGVPSLKRSAQDGPLPSGAAIEALPFQSSMAALPHGNETARTIRASPASLEGGTSDFEADIAAPAISVSIMGTSGFWKLQSDLPKGAELAPGS
jgi:hypothetical protein